MTLVQLANFIRIAELRNLSKAAAVLRIAQPALSRQVRLLEAELGAALLLRHPWGVEPTEAGEAFLTHAREVLRAVERAKDAVEGLAAEPSGRVAVGVPATLASCILPPLALRLRTRFPRLRPQFVDDFSTGLHTRIHAGELDLAVLYEERGMGPLATVPLLREPLMLIHAPLSGVATAAQALQLGPIVLSARPSRLREIVDDVLSEQDIDASLIVEFDSLPAIIGMVARGVGCTLLPFSTVQAEVARGELTASSLAGSDRSRTLVLARPLTRLPSAAIVATSNEIKAIVSELAPSHRWTPLDDSCAEE